MGRLASFKGDAETPNPLLAPYDYDGVVWYLGCGIVSESVVEYA